MKRVLLSYFVRSTLDPYGREWVLNFIDLPDTRRALGKIFTLPSEQALREFVGRMVLIDPKHFEDGIELGRGTVEVELTPEQVARLTR